MVCRALWRLLLGAPGKAAAGPPRGLQRQQPGPHQPVPVHSGPAPAADLAARVPLAQREGRLQGPQGLSGERRAGQSLPGGRAGGLGDSAAAAPGAGDSAASLGEGVGPRGPPGGHVPAADPLQLRQQRSELRPQQRQPGGAVPAHPPV